MTRNFEDSARSAPHGSTEVGVPSPDTVLQVQFLLRPPSGAPPFEETAWKVVESRQPWSIDDYRKTYAADPKDVAVLKDFAEKSKLEVAQVNTDWRTVTLVGTVKVFQEVFHIGLKDFQYQGQGYRLLSEPLSLPPELSDVVQWVFDLSKFPIHQRAYGSTLARPRTSQTSSCGAAYHENFFPCDQGPWTSLLPPSFAKLYDFPEEPKPELAKKKICLGTLLLLGGYATEDMNQFFEMVEKEFESPRPVIRAVGTNRLAKGEDAWVNFEATMDVQIASSCAPSAQHAVYFSGVECFEDITVWTYVKLFLTALFDQENEPSVLTMSAGLPEGLVNALTKSEAMLINELFMIAAILGVTICLPSGDSGSIYPLAEGMFSAPSLVYFPGSSPWVLCCGGTTLIQRDGAVENEVVWNRFDHNMMLSYGGEKGQLSNMGSSTGGVSFYFPLPKWQERANVPAKVLYDFDDWSFSNPQRFQGRGCPDVAANADFLVGYRLIVNGQPRYGGGTSASTPFIAAMITRMCEGVGRRLGFINPILYELQLEQNANICRPIVEGNNGGYTALPNQRWNPCTGLGSLQGRALLEKLMEYYKS